MMPLQILSLKCTARNYKVGIFIKNR